MAGRCSRCNEEGMKSTVTGGDVGWSTLMYCAPFYDEEGQRHSHDMNHTTYEFRCSQGHHWTEQTQAGCGAPGCTVTGSREITYKEAVE